MNNKTRTALIVALSIFGAGVVICFCVAMSLHFDLSKLTGEFHSSSGSPSNVKNEHIDKNIESKGQNIILNLSSASVTVTPSSDGTIHISYDNTDSYSFELVDSASQLKLTQEDKYSFFHNFLSFQITSPKVTLSIPSGQNGSLNVNGASSEISATGLKLSGNIELNSVSGKISVKDCKSKTLKAGNTSGEIELNSFQADSLQAGTVSGALKVTGISDNIPVTLESTSGEVYAENINTDNLGIKTISGGISLENASGKKANLSTTSGGVNLDKADFVEIDFTSVSGGIHGTVSGSADDYFVHTSTVSGSNNLSSHRGNGNRTLDMSTVSGGIDISFEK